MALTRKNALFAGNEIGAENWAKLASLVATCKLSGVNPVDYLADTLRAILDGHPTSRIEDLMPWWHARPSSLAALQDAACPSLTPISASQKGNHGSSLKGILNRDDRDTLAQ